MFSEDEQIKVAPLIFTAFVENAFKFLSSHSEASQNVLTIKLETTADQIIFFARNTIDANFTKDAKGGGIGIQNTINRLNLIYGSDYKLNYGKQGIVFEVSLFLPKTIKL